MNTTSKATVAALLEPERLRDPASARTLLPIIYDELRLIAERYLRDERPDHTLQPTALVHEAFLKLVDQTRVNLAGQTHFKCLMAQAMRRVLVDSARKKKAAKRGGGEPTVVLDETGLVAPALNLDLIALDEALEELSRLDERAGRVVEYRFFGGLTEAEIADQLGVSERTVREDWKTARAWLRCKLEPGA